MRHGSLATAALLTLLAPLDVASVSVHLPPSPPSPPGGVEEEDALDGTAEHVVCLLQRNSTIFLSKEASRLDARQPRQELALAAAVAPEPTAAEAQDSTAIGVGLVQKSKVALVLIEAFPPLWLLAVDRFYLASYRTAIAKLTVSLATCGVGGLVWGLIDFTVVMLNSLHRGPTLERFGLGAAFSPAEVETSFYVAIVVIAFWPSLVLLARGIWWWRRRQRDEMLREARAIKMPLNFNAADDGACAAYGTNDPKEG